MPFGVRSACTTFQRALDSVIGPTVEPYVFAYLDDIIVISAIKEQHVANLKEVFRRLREANLRLSWERFCQKELIYLGHVMSGEGIRKDARDPEADGPIELQGASAVPADGFVVSALCSQFCVSLAADDCFPEKGGNMTVGRGAINRIGADPRLS